MTREEMVEARDAAPTLVHCWAWCDRIKAYDEDNSLRAIWVDGPDNEAARAARTHHEPDPWWSLLAYVRGRYDTDVVGASEEYMEGWRDAVDGVEGRMEFLRCPPTPSQSQMPPIATIESTDEFARLRAEVERLTDKLERREQECQRLGAQRDRFRGDRLARAKLANVGDAFRELEAKHERLLDMLRADRGGDRWVWMNIPEEDDIETLSADCVVIIRAGDLRGLLAEATAEGEGVCGLCGTELDDAPDEPDQGKGLPG